MARIPKAALIALAGLTACGAHVDAPAPTPTGGPETANEGSLPGTPARSGEEPAPAAEPPAVAAIDDNLLRLRALDVFEVGDLIVQMPAEALNCYGAKPCAGSEAAVAQARSDAAERLARFANTLELAASSPYDSYACDANVDLNLEALRTLAVVELGSFIRSQPENSSFCYNLPCQSDIDAANQVNHDRAAKLENMAISTLEF